MRGNSLQLIHLRSLMDVVSGSIEDTVYQVEYWLVDGAIPIRVSGEE